MIVIEIFCHSPHASTQVSIQITGSIRVCQMFFKHPMTHFITQHCMFKINVIYGIIALFTTYQLEKSVTSTIKNCIITAKKTP